MVPGPAVVRCGFAGPGLAPDHDLRASLCSDAADHELLADAPGHSVLSCWPSVTSVMWRAVEVFISFRLLAVVAKTSACWSGSSRRGAALM